MGAKSKSGKVRKAARRHAPQPAGKPARRAMAARDCWDQATEIADERVDEVDCERIVNGDGGRRRPVYSDDYN